MILKQDEKIKIKPKEELEILGASKMCSKVSGIILAFSLLLKPKILASRKLQDSDRS